MAKERREVDASPTPAPGGTPELRVREQREGGRWVQHCRLLAWGGVGGRGQRGEEGNEEIRILRTIKFKEQKNDAISVFFSDNQDKGKNAENKK